MSVHRHVHVDESIIMIFEERAFCPVGATMVWYWFDKPGKSRASASCDRWKPRNFQWRPLLQKLMARSGLSATTREVNVGVEFPISCYPFFLFSYLLFVPPSPSIDEAFRVDAIKCHKMKCPTMKANDGDGVRRKRTSENEQSGQSWCTIVRSAFDASVKCTASYCRV